MNKLAAIKRFIKDDRGANLVEYIILVGLVALITIAAFQKFGTTVSAKVKAQTSTVDAVNAGSGQLGFALVRGPRR